MISFQFHFEKALSPFKRRTFKLYFWPPVSKTSFTIQSQKIFLRYLMAFSDLMFDEWFFFDLCEVILHIPYSARTLCRRLYVPWHLWQNLRTGYEKLANLISIHYGAWILEFVCLTHDIRALSGRWVELMGNLLKILGCTWYYNLREHGSVTKRESKFVKTCSYLSADYKV